MKRNEKRMAQVAVKLNETPFYQVPAYCKGNYSKTGGLLEYSTNVWLALERLTEEDNLEWKDPSSPFVIAMVHMLCNTRIFFYNHDYRCWELSKNQPKSTKWELSLKIAEELGIGLTEEEKVCIKWCIACEGDFVDFLVDVERYPNIIMACLATIEDVECDEEVIDNEE